MRSDDETEICRGTVPPPRPASGSRRLFLAGSGLAALGAAGYAGTLQAAARVPSAVGDHGPGDGGSGPMRFAMVTDTHVNLEYPDRTADLVRVFEEIDRRDPAFVINCGDVTDNGTPEQFDEYQASVPTGLCDRMHVVPGNHEEQWNADALESFRQHFGRTRYSFDAGGLHVVGLDPLVSQEWRWYCGPDLLDWLAEDLRAVDKDVPIILFDHFPLGGGSFFVSDNDDVFKIIQPYNVRALFGGHIHRAAHTQYNGLTQVIGNAIRNGPYFYWAEQQTGEQGSYLQVTEVTVPAAGAPTERPMVQVPLDAPGPGGAYGPLSVTTTVGADRLAVRVRPPAGSGVSKIDARVFPQVSPAPSWATLSRAGDTWSGTVPLTGLAPGRHRVELAAGEGTGVLYYQTDPFATPTRGVDTVWDRRLTDARLQGDLVADDGRVVAVSTAGEVFRVDVTSAGADPTWRVQLGGGVYKGAAITRGLVIVGSADHHLYALSLGNGRRRWQVDLGAPVTADLLLAGDGAAERVYVAAGGTLYAIRPADGRIAWQADLGGWFTGQVAVDDDRVYAGSSDGNVKAFAVGSGAPGWVTPVYTTHDSPGGRVAWGPQAARMRLLGDDKVLATTFDGPFALDRVTGEIVWSNRGHHRVVYTPPQVTPHGVLVFDDKVGVTLLVDSATGATTWTSDVLPSMHGAGPVPAGEPGTYWMMASSGLLAHLDPGAPSITPLLQVSTVFTNSTPVVVGQGTDRILVTAAEDGHLRGIGGLGHGQ